MRLLSTTPAGGAAAPSSTRSCSYQTSNTIPTSTTTVREERDGGRGQAEAEAAAAESSEDEEQEHEEQTLDDVNAA